MRKPDGAADAFLPSGSPAKFSPQSQFHSAFHSASSSSDPGSLRGYRCTHKHTHTHKHPYTHPPLSVSSRLVAIIGGIHYLTLEGTDLKCLYTALEAPAKHHAKTLSTAAKPRPVKKSWLCIKKIVHLAFDPTFDTTLLTLNFLVHTSATPCVEICVYSSCTHTNAAR